MNETRIGVLIFCTSCGEPKIVFADPEDVKRYRAGKVLVQDAFPYLTPAERELFVSRTCGTCWDKMFKEEAP